MVVQLDDEDYYVRRAAVDVIGKQAALSDELLMAVTARLEDEDSPVRMAAFHVLMCKDENISRVFCKAPFVAFLYKALLERSFSQQLSWHIKEDHFSFSTADGIRDIIINTEQDKAQKWINKVRRVGQRFYY